MTLLAPPERKVRVRHVDVFGWVWSYHLTPAQYQEYLDACTLKRAKLYVQERKRGPIMTDAAAENIASGMRAFSGRWLARVSR